MLNHVKKEIWKKSNSFIVSKLTNVAATFLFMIFDILIPEALAEVVIWKLDIAWDLSKSAWLSFEGTQMKFRNII